MSPLLISTDELWMYIRATKEQLVRTIVFSVDYSRDTVKITSILKRGNSTEIDVDNILTTISGENLPQWFIVRLDFESNDDSAFAVGHCGSFSLSVSRTAEKVLGKSRFRNYESKQSLESAIWDHLFPIHDTPGSAGAIVLEGITTGFPTFKYLGSRNVKEMCESGRIAFLISSNSVFLLNPDPQCPICGPRTLHFSQRDRAVYAFMKPDLAKLLGPSYAFLTDVTCCADAVISQRRRSNQEVLSPPTLEKYQKSSSKRTRNFFHANSKPAYS